MIAAALYGNIGISAFYSHLHFRFALLIFAIYFPRGFLHQQCAFVLGCSRDLYMTNWHSQSSRTCSRARPSCPKRAVSFGLSLFPSTGLWHVRIILHLRKMSVADSVHNSRHWLRYPSSWCYDWLDRRCLYFPIHLVRHSSKTTTIVTHRLFAYSTFPPLLWFLFELKRDAALEDEKFTGYGSNPRQIDTWSDASRWRRGLFEGRWYVKFFMLVIFLASVACAGLGFWGKLVII